MNTRNFLKIKPSFIINSISPSRYVGCRLRSHQLMRMTPRAREPLRAVPRRPPSLQKTFQFVEVKLSSRIVASESLKLPGISDGTRGDDAAVAIRIVEIFSEETFGIVLFSNSFSTSSSPKTEE